MSDTVFKNENKIKSLIKWPGGKQSELKVIKNNTPDTIKNYYEPFLGGGAVYFALNEDKVENFFVNDISKELMNFYNRIKIEDDNFINTLYSMDRAWTILQKIVENNQERLLDIYKSYRSECFSEDYLAAILLQFVNDNLNHFKKSIEDSVNIETNKFISDMPNIIFKKIKRMKNIEIKKNSLLIDKDILDNIESAIKAGYYTHIRYLYNNFKKFDINNSISGALFYFIREYCYSSMFRYNADGEFNVPYGGISYNRKNFKDKIKQLENQELKEKFKKTEFANCDFEEFFKDRKINKDDFIFLDPPYDTDFSTYSNNEFINEDHVRLANFCKSVKGKFMLVIKNTDFIYDLYKDFNISSFDKKYTVSFKNRNDRNVKHLMIKNY